MRLTSVRDLLAVAQDTLTDADREAFSLSLLWAQSVARKSSTDPASDTYDRALTAELSRIAWNVTAAATIEYDSDGSSVSPGAVVRTMLDPYLDAEHSGLGSLFDAIGHGSIAPKLGDFLTTWWGEQRTDLAVSGFAVGPVGRGIKGLGATILFYAYDLRVTSWQSFFVAKTNERFKVTALPVTLVLNDGLWQQIKEPLADKLSGTAMNYIRHLDIDL